MGDREEGEKIEKWKEGRRKGKTKGRKEGGREGVRVGKEEVEIEIGR